MTKIIHGDLLESNARYICHQVNCLGVMGAGIAKQIKERHPQVFFEYHTLCERYKHEPAKLLGDAQVVRASPMEATPLVCNLFGQVGYGRHSKQTELQALQNACERIASLAQSQEIIAMPYRIGCGLAGGDWGEVMDMLTEVFKARTLYLYKL